MGTESGADPSEVETSDQIAGAAALDVDPIGSSEQVLHALQAGLTGEWGVWRESKESADPRQIKQKPVLNRPIGAHTYALCAPLAFSSLITLGQSTGGFGPSSKTSAS
jgi:hypothetical protein